MDRTAIRSKLASPNEKTADLEIADLMRLSGYVVPGATDAPSTESVAAALFADLTADEREELVEYLAWYRARRRISSR
jgi:hypothetical protein